MDGPSLLSSSPQPQKGFNPPVLLAGFFIVRYKEPMGDRALTLRGGPFMIAFHIELLQNACQQDRVATSFIYLLCANPTAELEHPNKSQDCVDHDCQTDKIDDGLHG